MESVFYEFETQNLINMNAREKLDEFAEMTGINKNQLIGWSIAADFAEWYAEQVKNCSIPAVVGRSEQLVCPHCKGLEVYIDEYGGKPCQCTKEAN